ncbi:hypothetical protein TNCV_1113701 [Trichonephila clavipes]|nr:hypothetical protein TNCV_1113701 [Trichonephila clavipes]
MSSSSVDRRQKIRGLLAFTIEERIYVLYLSGHSKPNGHGPELVSSTVKSRGGNLVPLKAPREEGLKHIKSVEAQRCPVGVVWKIGEGDASSGAILST